MNQFKNEEEMLKELDNFMYKTKSLRGSFLRDELISRIKEFLEQQGEGYVESDAAATTEDKNEVNI